MTISFTASISMDSYLLHFNSLMNDLKPPQIYMLSDQIKTTDTHNAIYLVKITNLTTEQSTGDHISLPRSLSRSGGSPLLTFDHWCTCRSSSLTLFQFVHTNVPNTRFISRQWITDKSPIFILSIINPNSPLFLTYQHCPLYACVQLHVKLELDWATHDKDL